MEEGITAVHSRSQLDGLLAEHPDLCLEFTAKWCVPCQRFRAKYLGFPPYFPQVRFCSADVDDSEDLADKMEVETLPTFLLFVKGKESARVIGLPHKRPAQRLSKALREHFGDGAPH